MTEPGSCGGKPKQFKIRLIALLLCVCFIAAVLLSAAFILTHANHAHDHDGPGGSCVTCACISLAQNVLKSLFTAALGAAAALAYLFAVCALLASAVSRTDRYSLVSLKIRLNN